MIFDFSSILIDASQSDYRSRVDRLQAELSLAGFLRSRPDVSESVAAIISDVGANGDKALAELTKKFDKVSLKPSQFRIEEASLKEAHEKLDPSLLSTLRKAIKNVQEYQKQIFVARGQRKGIKYSPLKRVGLCIPGASAPLPSTVIMTAVPAKVAGVEDIVVVSPPRYNKSIHPVILGLCWELGIKEVYRVGGAQAVAALAWGTQTIKKVDKIAGPGNWYVSAAKRQVYGLVDIDSIAGPSEVLVIANHHARANWIAADMLSQLEHDPGSAICLTDSKALALSVIEELQKQVGQLSRSEAALNCLKQSAAVIVYDSLTKAVEFANEFAAEHLQIQCGPDSQSVARKIHNAGAIFIGDYTPVAVGDYWAGPSHTLPSGRSAAWFSPLSANDFVKSTSIISYTRAELEAASEDIIKFAQVEGLDAHAKSVAIRNT